MGVWGSVSHGFIKKTVGLCVRVWRVVCVHTCTPTGLVEAEMLCVTGPS